MSSESTVTYFANGNKRMLSSQMERQSMGLFAREKAIVKQNDAVSDATCDDSQCLLMAVLESFDQLGVGIVIVRADGDLLCTNRIGQMMLEDTNAGGTIVHSSKGLATVRGPKPQSRAKEKLESGPHTVQVLSSHLSPNETAVSILILAQPVHCSISHSALDEIFGLTPAESKLANLLMSGMSLADCCEQLEITGNTAAYHMKNLFRKTAASGQNQLLSTLFRSIGISGAARNAYNVLSDNKLLASSGKKEGLSSIYKTLSLLRIPKIRKNPPEWT